MRDPEKISAFLLEPDRASIRLTTGKKNMLGFQRDKERERFYLLPGQGGKAFRRKQRLFLLWAVVFGLLFSAAFAGFLHLISRH